MIMFTQQTNKAMTNSHPNVKSKSLCNVEKTEKNGLLCGMNLLPHHCRVHIQCMFAAGPNERIFAVITFVAAAFVPCSSCVCARLDPAEEIKKYR